MGGGVLRSWLADQGGQARGTHACATDNNGPGCVHSVETGCVGSPGRWASAAWSVCQARVAHLTRTGNSRTPAKTASLPSVSAPRPPAPGRR